MGFGTEVIDQSGAPGTGRRRESLGSILARDATRAVFQPIVELDSGAVVGFEALARGPAGSPLARPDAMFDAARAGDLVAELDWTCRAAAFGAALDEGLGQESTLFVNVEPDALDAPCPVRHRQVYESARAELRVAVEITERALAERPAELLAAVSAARERGWGVALDDIGADRRSLALMSLLRPDVLKLDLRLVQGRPATERAQIAGAVAAQAERTGAAVLAEGIERPAHVITARSLGAKLGQGWHLGRPGSLVEAAGAGDAGPVLPLAAPTPPRGRTPFEVVTSARPARRGTEEVVLAIGRDLTHHAEALGDTAVVLARLDDPRPGHDDTRRRCEELADRVAFVATLGPDTEPSPGRDPASATPDDREHDVVVLGPHFAAALVAREAGGGFDFAVTHDRDLVVDCARSLMVRIAPSAGRN